VSSSSEAVTRAEPDARSGRGLQILAWVCFALFIVGAIAGTVLDLMAGRGFRDPAAFPIIAFPIVGVLLATRRPHNPLGWLMLGASAGFAFPGESYAYYATVTRHGQIAGAAFALFFGAPTWVPFIGLSGYMLMLFPDGHLPTPRWRWFAWTCGIGLVLLYLVILVSPGNGGKEYGLPQLINPMGIEAMRPVFGPLLITVVFAPLTVVGGAVAIFVRLRRTTDAVQRQQLRWLAWAAGVIAVAYLIAFIPNVFGAGSSAWGSWLGNIAVATFMLIPITIGIAVLKYRLYDIDVVIRKTVLYAVLAVLIFATGFVLVWVMSGLFASSVRGGRLDLLAGVAIGLLFWPLRRVATRIADRIVYGGRATPYEVLSDFGDRLGGTYAADDILPRIARVLAEGVGADRGRVWLTERGELVPVATWTREGADPGGSDEYRAEVRHQGERLGALSVAMPANDPMDPAKEKLVSDLAAQAGLLLRNVRLVEELRASRRRLVAAQDEERRRLERNIHDGAQQQLVALTVKARLARQLTQRDPEKAALMLEQIEGESQAALEDLRDLARGIYPPLLADKGLVSAIEAQARKSPVPVTVHAEELARFGPEVEAAAYFSVLEAMQNVSKYAEASTVTVTLDHADGALRFVVTDDGRGFEPATTGYGTGLQGIADRLGALDGSLQVESTPHAGTVLTGRIPAMPLTDHAPDADPAAQPRQPHAAAGFLR
jgi:signal transduction histidine kinase